MTAIETANDILNQIHNLVNQISTDDFQEQLRSEIRDQMRTLMAAESDRPNTEKTIRIAFDVVDSQHLYAAVRSIEDAHEAGAERFSDYVQDIYYKFPDMNTAVEEILIKYDDDICDLQVLDTDS